jgi:hypothetical protein
MSIVSKLSSAQLSVIYITAGALIDVWSGIWCVYLAKHDAVNDLSWYLCWGLVLSGLVLVGIGLILGQIERVSRNAQLAREAAAAVAQAQTTAPVITPVLVATSVPTPLNGAPALMHPVQNLSDDAGARGVG